MANSETIDNKVKPQPSFSAYLWKEGKFALAVCGAAYVLHGGYRLYQANAFLEEYRQLQREEDSELKEVLTTKMEREKLGLGHDFNRQIFRIEVQDALDDIRRSRMKVIAERALIKYNLALNPFYKRLP